MPHLISFAGGHSYRINSTPCRLAVPSVPAGPCPVHRGPDSRVCVATMSMYFRQYVRGLYKLERVLWNALTDYTLHNLIRT